jgi:hypothetical protein
MKTFLLLLAITFFSTQASQAQFKEAAQLATLSPTILVATNSSLENYLKLHYTVSTVTYLGTYMITDSIWKSAAITLVLGAAKELIYDNLIGGGTPLWQDMAWNTLGTAQGVIFTVSLKF